MSSEHNTASQFNPEEAWSEKYDSLFSAGGKPYDAHRQAFINAYPTREVRCIYDPSLEPGFNILNGDHPADIDYTLRHVQGKHALVITASGFAWLAALARNARHVDGVDTAPEQTAWVYAQAAFIAMTPKEALQECLSALRETDYNPYVLKSMELTPLRKHYLDNLPRAFEALAVPTEYQPFITHTLSHCAFNFDNEMQEVRYPDGTMLWDIFEANYKDVRRRIIRREGWDLHVEDLNTWLQDHPNQYGAIHTSNVFDWMKPPMTAGEFAARVSNALEPGGVGNVASMSQDMRGLTRSMHPVGFHIDRITSRKDGESRDFLVIQKM